MTDPAFQADAGMLLEVLKNRKPGRLPLYEHQIDVPFISRALGREISLQGRKDRDYRAYYSELCGFWRDMTFDAFAYEAAICEILPGHGAIRGGMLGPVQTRADFERYPFDDIPRIFWEAYKPHLGALRAALPPGMRAYGGCGYGIFETSEDLVGYESLATMQYLDPELFRDLYRRIGELFVTLWTRMVREYADLFVFFRMGDDLGFKTSTLLAPETIREHILPQYRRVVDIVHGRGKRFLLHSCGNIFSVMEDLIALGIDAKHSNEDQIAPFSRWIELYSSRIGLLGGIDVNVLCLNDYDEVFRTVLGQAAEHRRSANGYALGSGNSIAEYVPLEGFMAMVDAAKELRRKERSR
jgi:uroporphyrinogen decarboxylase